MQFPYSYFEDEVRDGFYVPSMMKHAWAAQLEVLEAISKVCEKYHITYFADCGTLLGAVRHGGFIPWDDDMDICMKRQDYQKFLAVAEKALPEGYSVLSIHNDEDYYELFARVVNSRRIQFDQSYLEKFHGFPFACGIDIFPMDYLPTDEEEMFIQNSLLQFVLKSAKVLENNNISKDEIEEQVCKIEEICNTKIDRTRPLRNELYLLADKLCSLYVEQEAEEITLMPVWVDNPSYKILKNWYGETVKLPFENTKLPVPAAYDAILRYRYGTDYMRPVHNWNTHGYPFYKKQEATLHGECSILPKKYVFSIEDLQRKKHMTKKAMKEQAEKDAAFFGESHGKIENALEDKNMVKALELLEECQNKAICLGTMIEDVKGEGFATVGILEEYCEMVYQIHEEIIQGKTLNHHKTCEELKEMLDQIADSVKNDMKVRREAVFLPYKATMWDSLESVWKAADEDPDCDAYVIPIPYYDKNPDGTFRERHYEGEQYPAYVPITRYDTFDFAGRHPDMIFIQNPYDEYNYAISVEPFFYAKNLKKYTDNLIYIPYFVLDEISPQDERAITNLKYFVTVPGVIHADKVIVQSENMKQLYVEKLAEFAGEETRKIWEKKISGIGSPKFDKGAKIRKEELNIPEEWKQVLRKEDGSYKKVVLYHNNVSTLLEYQEQMLEKLREVLSVFKENREEAALLWRPDSLIREKIQSENPKLWIEYQGIVQQYREESWGIYDDTVELERAVAVSDVYYGDPSDAVQVCKSVGMPVMLQRIGEN